MGAGILSWASAISVVVIVAASCVPGTGATTTPSESPSGSQGVATASPSWLPADRTWVANVGDTWVAGSTSAHEHLALPTAYAGIATAPGVVLASHYDANANSSHQLVLTVPDGLEARSFRVPGHVSAGALTRRPHT